MTTDESERERKKRPAPVDLLRLIAVVNLIAGVVGGIIGLNGTGGAQAGPATTTAILFSVAWIAEGIIGCVFLLVVCVIAETLLDIKESLARTA
jgi:hypothetical protein